MKTLSLFGYLIIVLGVFGLWRTGSLFAHHPWLLALQIAAVGLMIWARAAFGLRSFHPGANPTAGGLVTTGPYRYIRHPIYASICLFCAAGLAPNFNIPALGFFGVVIAGALIRIMCEERLLVRQYPEYKEYSGKTSRIIPGIY